MGFSCGIIGLPGCGKTTLFNALTRLDAKTSSYHSSSDKPNIGTVPVLDERLQAINEFVKSKTVTPTTVKFVDIPGISSNGKKSDGLGSTFLAAIRETEAIVHVVRLFETPDSMLEEGIDPVRDIQNVQTELGLKDLETLENIKNKLEKKARGQDKTAALEMEFIDKISQEISDSENGLVHLNIENDNENQMLSRYNLLTIKPVIFVANISEELVGNVQDNPYFKELCSFLENEEVEIIPICAKLESDLGELDDEEAKEFAQDFGITETGINLLVKKGYHMLKLLTYFTAGEKEVRAWTITQESTAKQAAGKIHSDLERGFIRAEVISYDHFLDTGSWSKARELGKVRLEGKDYIVKDGDIMLFRFNV